MFKICSFFLFGSLVALPRPALVPQGTADIQSPHHQLLEVAASDQTVIHWQEFSIAEEESVRFIQPDAEAILLNRVIGPNPSEIMGRLESNGKLILLNPNGLLVGKEACIDTNSFFAMAFDVMDEALLARKSLFLPQGNKPIVIEGRIRAEEIRLASDSLKICGTLDADRVDCHAGSKIEHFGRILGKEKVSLHALNGTILADGFISAQKSADYGGEIHIFGLENRIGRSAYLDVSADVEAGAILIGGDYQGQNYSLSLRTFVEAGAKVYANGLSSGDGGKIIVWGTEAASFDGNLECRGGPFGGNGGLAEISSTGAFSIGLNSWVDTSAPIGNAGKLLLDPATVVISTAADSGIMTLPPPGYVFNAATAFIDVAVLNTLLLANDVEINASASGPGMIGSITLNANTDVPAGSSIVWNAASPTRLSLIANGFINIRNGILSQNTTAAATTPIIQISAPTVTIGDPSLTLGNVAIVQVTTGHIAINAPTALNIYGNTSSAGGVLAGTPAPTDLASITVNAGSLTCQSGSQFTLITANGDVNIAASGNMQMISGTAPSGIQTVNPTGTIFVRGQGNFGLQGGGGVNSSSAIVANFGGTVDVAIAGDYIFQGGSATNDGNTGISVNSGTGSVTVSGRDYFFTGGSAGVNNNICAVGLVNTAQGTVDVTATGANGIVCNAMFSNSCGFLINSSIGNNSLNLRTTHLTLNGSTDPMAMQGGSQVQTNSGSLTLNATGNINLNGGQGLGFNIAAIINNGSGQTTISANRLTAIGGSSVFSVASILSFNGPFSASFAGDCTLTGGSGMLSLAVLASAATSGTGDLNITGQNFYATGGSGMQSHAGFFTGDITMGGGGGNGSILITSNGASGIYLTGGAGSPSFGGIGTYGTGSTNGIQVSARGNLVLDSPGPGPNGSATIFTDAGGGIDLAVGQNVVLNDTAGNLSSIRVGAGGNATLQVLAGQSISVHSTIENLGLGNLVLIVDANSPAPLVGSGAFILGSSGLVNTSGGLLQIYTARQSLNSISGLLNGLVFVPGPLFADTNQEAWCVFYPFGSGGIPFIIFYKECLALLANQASLISDEALDDLHPSNENPGWHCQFQIRSKAPDVEWTEDYFIRRRHLKTIYLPKSYTIF